MWKTPYSILQWTKVAKIKSSKVHKSLVRFSPQTIKKRSQLNSTKNMAIFRQYIAPLLVVLVFILALVAVSARIFLPSDMAAPAPIEEVGMVTGHWGIGHGA
ncbi:hypothetical protein CLI64_12645 [Nostoc sp. CENA543]|uniref:hypothetical protein n=1 Tax=Nostoc sp. CENA543 TaxID=1869241 RepID=UPI000CA2BD89|nr:hypothetical protein [Nostoc sp. CENA543]AUT01182.1 hypothetical protein CLI64_12645 [Nostoc sp. CENA543]